MSFRCTVCDGDDTTVKDSRYSHGARQKRRRRICRNGHAFSTVEIPGDELSRLRAIELEAQRWLASTEALRKSVGLEPSIQQES